MLASKERMALLALVAVATAPAGAVAEHSVQAWGIFDAGVSAQNNRAGAEGGKLVTVCSGGWQTSRLQLRGSLDLIGDLKGVAELGTSINMSSGQFSVGAANVSVGSGTMFTGGRAFDRVAYVGLSSATFGGVQFGRQPTVLHDTAVVTDPLRANNGATNMNVRLGYLVSPGYFAPNQAIANRFGPNANLNNNATGNGLDRQDNAVKYVLKKRGLVAELMYAFGGVAGSVKNSSSMGALLGYDGKALTLRGGLSQFRDASGMALVAGMAGVSYLIGPFKLKGTFAENRIRDGATYGYLTTLVWSGGVTATVIPELDVTLAYYGGRRTQEGVPRKTAGKFYLVPEVKLGKGFLLYAIADYERFGDAQSNTLDTGTTLLASARDSVYFAGGLSYTF